MRRWSWCHGFSLWLLCLAVLAVLVSAASVPAQCTNCVNGVCYDEPATTDNQLETPNIPIGGWASNGDGTISFYQVYIHARRVTLKTCGGLPFVVRQVMYCTVYQAYIPGTTVHTVAPSNPVVAGTPAMNGPSTGGPWPPPTNPPFLTYVATNCHAASVGLGPSTGAPLPTTPAPPAPPAGGGTTLGPATGGGYRVESDAASAIFKDPCWARCAGSCFPPPTGSVVIWYTAPEGPNGQPDHAKGKAMHSATRREDGEYDSKNGSEPDSGPSSKSELDNKYGHDGEKKNGHTIHQVTMVREC